MGETGGDQRRFGFPGPARPEREQDYSCFRKADPRRAAGFGSSRKRHCPLLRQLRTGIVCDSRHTPKQNGKTMELRGTILSLPLKVSLLGVRTILLIMALQSGAY